MDLELENSLLVGPGRRRPGREGASSSWATFHSVLTDTPHATLSSTWLQFPWKQSFNPFIAKKRVRTAFCDLLGVKWTHICLNAGIKNQCYFLSRLTNQVRRLGDNLPLKVPNITKPRSRIQTDFGPTEGLPRNYPQNTCHALLDVRQKTRVSKDFQMATLPNAEVRLIRPVNQ